MSADLGPPSALRRELLELLESTLADPTAAIDDKTSLIRSGMVDSVVLLRLAVWVEERCGVKLDLTSFDLIEEWDTIPLIIDFVQRRRRESGAQE